MSVRSRIVTVAALSVALTAGLLTAQTPPTYKPEQKVEVREGDVWSAATVTAVEGRRVQVKYDDGTLEWVPTTRLRLPGASSDTAPAGGDSNTAPAAPKAPPAERVPASGRCEIKDGDKWKPGTVHNHDGDLYLVELDGWKSQFFWRWVSVDCVRAVGSTKAGPNDGEGVSLNNSSVQDAKAKAKTKLAAWKAAAKQDAADAASGTKRSPFDPIPYDKPVTPVDTNGLHDLLPQAPSGAWAYLPAASAAKPAGRSVVLRAEKPFAAETSLLAGDDIIVLGYKGGGMDAINRIEKVSLSSGTVTFKDFDPMSVPVAISPDGKRLLGRANGFFGGTKNRVDLWSIEAADPKHLVSFEPFADESDKNHRDVTFAALIDDNTVLTGNNDGTLAAWSTGDATATTKAVKSIWRMRLSHRSAMALSPSRKTLAVVGGDGVALIDPATGDTQQLIATPAFADSIAFTPDGKRLISVSGSLICTWDLTTGTAGPDIGLPPEVNARSVVGVSSDFALLGGKYLFDLVHGRVTWEYDKADEGDAVVIGGRTWVVIGDRTRRVLASAELPDGTVRQAAADQAGGPLLKPGDRVSLDVSLDGDDKQREAATAAIKKQLARDGLIIAEGQPVRIVARTEDGKTTQETWGRMGRPMFDKSNQETVNITEKITRIFFEDHGKIVWENRTVSRPFGFVRGEENKSIAQSVQDANKFNIAFLQSVRLPSIVPRFRDPLVPGKSAWTISGPVPVK